MKRKYIFRCVTSFLLSAMLILGGMQPAFSAAAAETAGKLPMPEITYSGLELDPNDSVPTTDEHLPYLIENESGFNFNFYPDQSKMAAGESWFEYSYDRSVDFSGLKLVGWWPNAQGVKEIGIQYFDGSAWQDGDRITVPWQTPVSEGGPEELEITFSQVITSTKLRIQVLSMYQEWDTPRCCMRLMSPIGELTPMETDEARDALGEALANARQAKDTYKDQVTSAAAAVLDYALATAQNVYDDENADSAALNEQMELIVAAQETYVEFAEGRAALRDAVTDAEALLAESEVGDGYGQHPVSAKEALVRVIDSCKELLLDESVTDVSLYTDKSSLLANQVKAFENNDNTTLSIPEISVVNMDIVKGDPSYLVDGSNRDFNVDPGSELKDAYIEYNYINLVRIYEIDLAGWFPLQQGVANLSFEYYEDGEWKLSDQNVQVPWTEPQIQDERLTITLSEPVETTKFRIKINDAYRDWSYICMHGMEPKGVVLNDILALFESAENMITQTENLLTGTQPGEIPEASVEEVRKLAQEVLQKLENGEVTSENFEEEMQKIEAAWQQMLKDQVPAYDDPYAPKVSAEGLTVTEGSLENLVDKQLALGAEFDTPLEDAYLVFDYGDLSFQLEQLTITAEDGAQKGFQEVSLEYFDGKEWIAAKENVTLKWRENAPNYQGQHVKLDTPVSASKFRIRIDLAADAPNVQEILLKGNFVTSSAGLEEAVARGEAVLEKGFTGIDDLLDVLKLRLASAKNPDTVNRATQDKLDEMAGQINDVTALIERYQEIASEEDKALLKDVIDEADSYELDRYVDGEAKDSFQDILQAAKDAYAKTDATKEEIDGARMELLDAMDRLRLRADKTNLNEWIEELKKLDLSRYTEESGAVLLDALARAEALAAQDLGTESNALIAQAIAELQQARENLVLKTEGGQTGDASGGAQNGANQPNSNAGAVTTGDTSNVTLYIILGAVALILIVIGVIVIRKRNQSGE